MTGDRQEHLDRRRRVVVAAVLGCFMAAMPLPATAGEDEALAAERLQQSVVAFTNGAFAESRRLLLEAQRFTRSPELLSRIALQLGLTSAAENRPEEARRHFRAAIAHHPSLELDPDLVKPAVIELFRSARRSLEGTLEVAGGLRGEEVWVGGQRVGALPLKKRMVGGEYRVEIRALTGKVLHRSTVKIITGQTYRLTLALLSSTKAGETPVGGSSNGDTAGGLSARKEVPGDLDQRRPRRRWTWVAGAVAVIAAGTAIGVGVSARADGDEACQLLEGAAPCEQRSHLVDLAQAQRYRELHERATSKALAANISWGVAAALAVGSILLYWLEGRTSPRAPVGHQGASPAFVRFGAGALELTY